MDSLLAKLHELQALLTQIADALWPLAHPNLVVAKLLNDSIGLVLKVWFGFILSTTDFETGGDFISNATIQRFEPKVQLLANAALVLIAVWASYRIMWGHGIHSQYSARILLPRLFMGAGRSPASEDDRARPVLARPSRAHEGRSAPRPARRPGAPRPSAPFRPGGA